MRSALRRIVTPGRRITLIASLSVTLAGCGGSGGPTTYTVSASVSGLSGSGLILQLNAGNNLAVTANGTSAFATPVTSGMSYQVTVKTQPSSPQQICTVSNGSGMVGTSNATVTISCVTVHTIGVSVSGLSGTGLVLQLNGGSDLPITADGTATFAQTIASGSTYSVAVQTQPKFPPQICTVANGSGNVGTAGVNGITVKCATSIETLYSFTGAGGVTGSTDGANPIGSLIQGSDGSLYGTTFNGGASIVVGETIGSGTAFKITLAWQETVLHGFGVTAEDGDIPVTGLVLGSDGNFYGATPLRTGNIAGSLYRISAAGTESVIYPFPFVCGVDDFPMIGNVIQGSDGVLYGAAYEGLPSGYGYAIYGITTTGAKVFTADIHLQLPPITRLNLVQTRDGSLYGTASGGGAYGMGVVFKAKPDIGTLYSFGGISDDALAPESPMIQGNDGNLYGTTATGGKASATCPHGCGTVFRITPSGTETVLYSFGSSPGDGQGPSGALVQASDGNFYGATAAGGSTASGAGANSSCKSANVTISYGTNVTSSYSGCGTLYRITPAGIATVLYSFGSNPGDGTAPTGALLQATDGNLYGATIAGGTADQGTVFRLVLGAN